MNVGRLLIAALMVASQLSAQVTKVDVIRFNPSTDPNTCRVGRYELFAVSGTNKFRACQNGVLSDLIVSSIDLSNYTGDVLLASTGGFNFIGVSDVLAAMGGGNGVAFSSVHAWPTGELILAYGDGTLNGGEGASLSGNPATGALTLAAGSLIASGPGIQYTPQASPPFACDAGHEGYEYADTSHAKCFCDGTTWNKLTGSGAGTCS